MTKHPQALQILRERESQLTDMLTQLPAILWATDKDLRITMVWGSGLKSLNLTPNETIGLTLYDYFQTQDPEFLPIAHHLKVLTGQASTYELELEEKVFHALVEPLRDEGGEVMGTLGVALDITERKRAEEFFKKRAQKALRFQNVLLNLAKMEFSDMEDSLKKIVKSDSQALEVERVSIWEFNKDRSAINCEILYKKSENVFEKGVQLKAQDYPNYFKALEESRTIAADDALGDLRTREFDETYLKPLGIHSMLDVPIRAEGRVIGIICHEHVGPLRKWSSEEQEFAASVADAVTLAYASDKRKRAEEKLKKASEELIRSNKELEQFAYVASHDLQEPVHKILAFGDRIKTLPQENEKLQDYLNRMLKAAGQMRQLIMDLLQFARVTTRAQPFISVALDGVIKKVLVDLDFRVSEKGAKVRVGPLPKVQGDPMQMQQLFHNLISNALKFSKPDQVPQVEIESRSHPQGWVEILVRDQGIGFDEAYIDKIFQPFQRLQSRSQYEGTGMGLSLCQKIVQRHGGTLSAKSSQGKGALFIVKLPLKLQGRPGQKNIL